MIERAVLGNVEQRNGRKVGGAILPCNETAIVELTLEQASRPALNRLVDVGVKLGRFAGAYEGAEIKRRRTFWGAGGGSRMAIAQRFHDLQIGIEKARKQLALHDEPDVSGTALLAVFEALSDLLLKLQPIGKFPHAIGVDALHFEHVG